MSSDSRMRLSPDEFETLVEAERPSDPVLGAAVDAVRRPLCYLSIFVAGNAGSTLHQGWVAPPMAAMLLHVGGTDYDLVAVRPDFLPAALARLVYLGPRGRRFEEVHVGDQVIDGLLSESPAQRIEAARTVVGDDASWRVWSVDVTWTFDSEDRTRGLVVLDRQDGLLVAEADQDGVRLVPIRATDAYTALTALLPRDTEVDWVAAEGGG